VETINLDGPILTINNPIFRDTVFCVELALNDSIAPRIFSAFRKNFDNKVRRASQSVPRPDALPALVAKVNEIRDDATILA
jgi:hypothetical protein